MNPIQTAATLLEAGRCREVIALCSQALAREPSHPGLLQLLAMAHSAEGDHAQAVALFRRLTELEPASADHWANLGTALRSAGEFEQALAAYQQAARHGADSADFLLNVALLHIDRLEYGRARVLLKEASALAPQNAEIRYFHAICNYEEVRTQDAQAELANWRSFAGLNPEMLIRIGTLLTQLGETPQAEEALRQALKLEPGNTLAVVRLAQLLERTNRLAEAREKMAAVDAHGTPRELAEEILSARARLAERDGDLEGARGQYQELLGAMTQPHQRYHVLFPLARVLDALGRYDEAFATLDRAHASQVAYLQKVAQRFLDPKQQAFNIANFSVDPADLARWDPAGAPSADESPVFIVGFPRSGTTLLEQALDAHPLLQSMDEQPFLQAAMDQMRGLGLKYPEALAALTPAQAGEVRARYWQASRARAGVAAGQRLIDKNPLNMLRLPAIQRLFPNARILLAVRHPCDVLISNFSQHFRAPEIAYMCRDLPSLAAGYRRAFDFWYSQAALLSPNVLELVYEDFVGDFEGHLRRIAGFLQIPWHDAMLKPGEQAAKKGYISTPSYSQVIQPVNRKAVGRWRRYERHLAGSLEPLEPYLRRWGYDAAAPADASTNKA